MQELSETKDIQYLRPVVVGNTIMWSGTACTVLYIVQYCTVYSTRTCQCQSTHDAYQLTIDGQTLKNDDRMD